jgi:ATP-dependent Lhr-like helicase
VWVAAERLPELAAVTSEVHFEPAIAAPPLRAAVAWTRDSAIVELLRGRLAMLGPITPRELGRPLAVDATDTLLALEAEGVVLRGWLSPGGVEEEWCDRRLLARIHRGTLQRLRAEIQPISASNFMRFLFEWQQVSPSSRASGVDGVRAAITRLDGFELAADAWDTHVLKARVRDYDPSMLDLLCYGGEAAWARLTEPPAVPASAVLPPRPVRATPVAIYLRDRWREWSTLAGFDRTAAGSITGMGMQVLGALDDKGAQFAHEIAAATGLPAADVRVALAELAWAGLVASDGFAGLRAMWNEPPPSRRAASPGGRWARLTAVEAPGADREQAVEQYAWALLHRYGIMCRRLLTREPFAVPWRELLRVYRRLEARGEVRGGRFVSGLPGEQFALPEAVELARRVRRAPASGETITISAADPLNLCGIVTPGDRIPAVASTQITFRDGIARSMNEAAPLTAAAH